MSETTQESALIKIVSEAGLPEVNSKMLVDHFREFEEKAHEWKLIAEGLVVTDVSQKEEMKQADEARKALVKVRTGIAKKHKELKDSALKEGRLYDLIKNTLTSFIEPIEEHLEKQANFEKIQIENERKRIQSERAQALSQYMENAESMPLADMNQDAFDNLLAGQKLAYDARIEAEKKAEQDRIDAEKAHNERKERFEKRNKELAIYWATMPAKYANFSYTDASEEEYQQMLQDAKDAKAKADEEEEAQRLENIRLKAEAEEKQKIYDQRGKELKPYLIMIRDYQAMLDMSEADYQKELSEIKIGYQQHLEYEAKKKAENDAKEKELADLKAKREKEEADEKARLAAEKKAQRAPDKQKLLTIVEKIELLQFEVTSIEFKDADAKKVSEGVVTLLEKIRVYVNENSSKL